MNMIRLKKKDLGVAVEKAEKHYTLAGPVPDRGSHAFQRLNPGQCPDLDYTHTRLSPKSLLFPQTEPMFRFRVPGGSRTDPFSALEPAGDLPLAVMGIRPWDARAFDLLKLNFDARDFRDPFFMARYEAMVRVGLADTRPDTTNFSVACGTGPFDDTCLDILLADAGDAFIGRVMTEKGRAFAEAAGFETGGGEIGETLAAMKAEADAITDATPAFDRILAADTLALYEAGIWEQASFACINCGTCTFSCPTCWCFDIQDEVKKGDGVRVRLWDTCMDGLYSAHASGHNPRQEGVERFRNRFMHKLKYFPDKYGQGPMCVGCGRCITQCPAGIDIRQVMAAMKRVAESAREEKEVVS